MGQKGVQSIFLGLLLYVLVISAAADVKHLNIWPMPKQVNHGQGSLYLGNDFELKTDGSKYPDSSGILKDGFLRIIDVVKATHVIDANFSHFNPSRLLKGIHIVISSPSDELQHGIDESYKLNIPAHGTLLYAHIEAQTIYGALHGLQTFSQVCHFNITTRAIVVHQVPWTIVDQPRFPYRGLLIDTSRHYQPLLMIKKVIDSMSYAKLNVLHWHIVDSQSFPLEIPSYPKLWDGAYSISERYTIEDAAEIVSYAQRRGINVLAEIDVPGHALSWYYVQYESYKFRIFENTILILITSPLSTFKSTSYAKAASSSTNLSMRRRETLFAKFDYWWTGFIFVISVTGEPSYSSEHVC